LHGFTAVGRLESVQAGLVGPGIGYEVGLGGGGKGQANACGNKKFFDRHENTPTTEYYGPDELSIHKSSIMQLVLL
jgi:hypothetical protein